MKMKKKWLWLLTVLVVPVGYAGIAMTGNLEPSGAPGFTMRTLEELQPSWGKKITNNLRSTEGAEKNGFLPLSPSQRGIKGEAGKL